MPITLFPDQQEALAGVMEVYKACPTGGRALVVAPTAWGKTIFFSSLINSLQLALAGKPVLIIAHRDELLDQAREKIWMIDPTAIVGKVGGGCHDYGAPITVASIDTIVGAKHLKTLPSFGYGLLICDESHHACAPKYQKVFAVLPDVFKLGVTATPDRLDGLSLEPIFGRPVFHMTIQEAVKRGRLSNVKAIAIRTETNLSDIKSKKNMDGEIDFNQIELDLAVNTLERNKRVVDAYQEHCPGQRGIVFAVSIVHAQALAYAFNEAGVNTACVTGDRKITPMEERKRIYTAFEADEIKILTNVMVLTEGFDAPGIECVIMARPTQSRGLYTQCVGRGLRLAPGKEICTILDLTDNCIKHKLQAPQNLAKAVGIDIKPDETLLDAMEREEQEQELREREARIRKLKSRRPRDIIVNLLDEPIKWTELANGIFVIEVTAEKHRVAICPSKSAPGLWHVDAKLAPTFHGQRWMENRPFEMCQSHAEVKIHQLLNGEKHLVDKNASWRQKPMEPGSPQAKKLKLHKITYREGITKGEASDLIDNHMSQIAATKAVKAERKRQREEQST